MIRTCPDIGRALAVTGLCLLLAGGHEARAQADRTSVSPRRAFWSSLLIPGWGQRQVGSETSAARFLAVEAILWTGFLGWEHVASIRRDTYRTYAADHAGARAEGKDGEFIDDLGFYQSRLQHNQFARVDEGAEATLYPSTAEYFWEWDRDASRLRFRDLRNSAESADRNALYATGMVLANHLVSAIHAARTARDAALERPGESGHRGAPNRRLPLDLALAARPGRFGAALVHRF